jgi:Conserved hypothetical ATP binding protein
VRSRISSPYHPPLRSSPQKRYNLGPNGAILTALNLFTTKLDQVLDLVEKRADTVECARISFAPGILSLMLDSVSIQLCDRRHTWSDRDLHLVSVWCNYYGCGCLVAPNRHRLHRRYAADGCACDIYVEYALCV